MKRALALLIIAHSTTLFAFDHNHATFNSVLKNHVNEKGLVNYRALKERPKQLDLYISQIGGVPKKKFLKWSRDQKLAYWINAYNALTFKAIIDHYPIKKSSGWRGLFYPANSIRQIKGVWKKFKWESGIGKVNLKQIEDRILRAELKEPRIHFVIVCAAKGCPVLKNKAYQAKNIDQQLDQAAKDFIRNKEKVRWDAEARTLHLSHIFKWFRADFGNLAKYTAKYLPKDEAGTLKKSKAKIKWIKYDWNLNEQPIEKKKEDKIAL